MDIYRDRCICIDIYKYQYTYSKKGLKCEHRACHGSHWHQSNELVPEEHAAAPDTSQANYQPIATLDLF